MKKIKLFSILTFVLVLFSCKKEVVINQKNSIIASIVLPPDANAEVHRIHNDVININYHLGVVISSMYGLEPKDPNEAPYFSGGGVDGLNVSINGQLFSGASHSWATNIGAFGSYFGATNELIFYNNSGDSMYVNRYFPVPQRMNSLTGDIRQSITINRTGNNITWNVDNNWGSNKIALEYYLHESEEGFAYDRGVLVIDNDGSYNIDHLLTDTKCKFVKLIMVSGNTASFIMGGKKHLFDITNYDLHSYYVN